MSGELVLIASYPKSGNTWVRMVLETLRRGAPVSINDLPSGAYGLQRRLAFDMAAPAAASELLPDEIDAVMPEFYSALADQANGAIFLKVHDHLRRTRDGRWLFPPDRIRGAIHIVRHPFDVAISYAAHNGVAPAKAAEWLIDPLHVVAPVTTGLPLPLAERTGSWGSHTSSWLDDPPFPVASIRYEDMIGDPAAAFAAIAAAAGLDVSKQAIFAAVETTQFERLRDEELRHGFRERPRSSPAFFRRGRPGAGAEELDPASRRLLEQALLPQMARFGYRS